VSDRILRLQHVQIRVPDLELCTAYYTEVLGLIETAHEENRVFLKCWDEHEHHSVVLRQAPTYGLDHRSFKVAELEDLDHSTERVEAWGIPVKRYGTGELGPGWGDAIRFDAPSGHTVELGFGMEKVGNMLPLFNPPPRPGNLVGIAPPRLDHIFIMAEDVDEATRFYREVLDFRLTEQIIANDGHQIATWLERSHTPHDLAMVTGPNGALHHFAFWVDDWNAVREAADLLAFNGVNIDVAPTRHGVTRGHTTYFFDPVGNRNEVFTGGYWVDPDFEPITWTEEEMGRAMFYYAREVNERFFTVHSSPLRRPRTTVATPSGVPTGPTRRSTWRATPTGGRGPWSVDPPRMTIPRCRSTCAGSATGRRRRRPGRARCRWSSRASGSPPSTPPSPAATSSSPRSAASATPTRPRSGSSGTGSPRATPPTPG
jgi:catechol 2,3-dioxygenase